MMPAFRIGPLRAGTPHGGLVDEVRRGLEGIPRGSTVAVGFSGGPDSTALVHLVLEARSDLILVLAHVRHGLRDDRTDVDAVTAHAAALQLDVRIADVVVSARRRGIEAAARDERYAALRAIAREAAAGWILLGHTADDQAETLLMRVARGTGVRGLSGMAPIRGELVRPLLGIRRQDIRKFVADQGLVTVDDPMNHDLAFKRVVARVQALPALEGLAADPVGALGRLADLAREDERYLADQASDIVARNIYRYGPTLSLRDAELQSHAPAMQWRVIRELIARVGDDDPPDAAHIQQTLSLRGGSMYEVAGVRVSLGGGWLSVAPQTSPHLTAAVPLRLPGVTSWPRANVEIVARVGRSNSSPREPGAAMGHAVVPPGATASLTQVVLGSVYGEGSDGPQGVPDGLVVRARRPGDVMYLKGGRRKLQDVFVDAGVPRVVRDVVPVVAIDGGDVQRVIWVPGIAADEAMTLQGERSPSVSLAVAGPELAT